MGNMISVSFFVWNKESMFPIDKSWEKKNLPMENMKETHNVFHKFFFQKHFVFPWEKPFKNHKTCL